MTSTGTADGQRLQQLLAVPGNNVCADCQTAEPRWSSWNLGIFICVRCAGIHRSLGSHISKVRSVNLDAWTPEQLQSIDDIGNVRSNAKYLATLPANHPRPSVDDAAGMQAWIRAKYERKQWVANRSDEAIEQEPEFMTVSVTDPRTDDDPAGSGRNRFTSYQVNVTTNMPSFRSGTAGASSGKPGEFSVRRRFNDFGALYKTLGTLAKAKFTKLPDMPPKTSLVEDRFSANVVEARRAAFERILKAVAENQALRRSDIVQRFLTTGLSDPLDRTASGSSLSTDDVGGGTATGATVPA